MAARILKRLALVLVGLFVAIVLVEQGIRVVDPYGVNHFVNMDLYRDELAVIDLASTRIFTHKPGHELDLHGFDVVTDSRGLRGPERAHPRPEGLRRVLFLGDSVVFGWGVDYEHTFVHQVELALNERADGPWEAINAGHLVHDSVQELAVLADTGLAYDPELVLLVYVDNDAVLTSEQIAPTRPKLDVPPEVVAERERAARRAELAAKLKPALPHTHALLQFWLSRSAAGQATSPEAALQDGFDLEWGLAKSLEAVGAMRELCASKGVRFAVLDIYDTKRLASFCEEQAIPYASIGFTDEELASGVTLSPSDPHANPLGHDYYTEHVLRAIAGLGLIPE